jgi:prepilin-type N-terminal cleavage/methylation domain-containing protein
LLSFCLYRKGFTLAELLICLAILAEIATFTIPKIITAQQNGAWKAEGKETIATIANAYQLYKMNNQVSSSTGTTNLVTFLNYTKAVTSGLVDHVTGQTSLDCSAQPCYQLHNGGMLVLGGSTFGSTNTTNYIHFFFDPDSQYSGTTNGPGKAITLVLYFNGRVATGAERQTGHITYLAGSPQNWGPDPSTDWFSW